MVVKPFQGYKLLINNKLCGEVGGGKIRDDVIFVLDKVLIYNYLRIGEVALMKRREIAILLIIKRTGYNFAVVN